MAVGEHDYLPVVAHLEELLSTAVHVADDRFGLNDALTVEDETQPEHSVCGWMLRTDVQDHVGGNHTATGADYAFLRHGQILACRVSHGWRVGCPRWALTPSRPRRTAGRASVLASPRD